MAAQQLHQQRSKMKNTNTARLSNVLASLVMPVSLGLALYLGLNILIERDIIENETILRYITGHPISHITVAMFCIGIAGLAIIANNVFDQFQKVNTITLETEGVFNTDENTKVEPEGHDLFATGAQTAAADQANQLTEKLEEIHDSMHHHYLWQRLHSAMQYVVRSGGAIGIEDELKYQAEVDYDQQQRRYSLVRIVIWATPMLGFLGTVLGISQALGGIQVGPDNDFSAMLGGLRESLYVAFDTTALALVLSIVLMFLQFIVDRFETQLLDTVDARAKDEVQALFKEEAFLDPKTSALERLGRTVIATSHQLVQRQTELWSETIRSAELAWVDSISGVSETVRKNLAETMEESVQGLGKELEKASVSFSESIDKADTAMASRWEQWQVMLSENARSMGELQTQNSRHMGTLQSEMKNQVMTVKSLMNKLDNVTEYQTAVNRNLDALSATSRLHKTLESLSSSLDKMNDGESAAAKEVPNLRIYRAIDARMTAAKPQKTSTSTTSKAA